MTVKKVSILHLIGQIGRESFRLEQTHHVVALQFSCLEIIQNATEKQTLTGIWHKVYYLFIYLQIGSLKLWTMGLILLTQNQLSISRNKDG